MKGKTMSKIFEALENAEKQRLRKGSSPLLQPREEKKTSPAPEPKSGWVERPALSPAPEPREVKRTAPVVGPRITPAPVLREENKTPPALESKSERLERPAPSPAPERREVVSTAPVMTPKEEKRIAPVPQPKEVRGERQQVVPPLKTVNKPMPSNRAGADRRLVSLFEPGSLGAEQFRKLRTHVLKLNMSDPPKTIMVTSATEGEGKTFVAANLAAGIAHDLHFHALLVDCDLRNPSLSHWFGVQNGHGLSDFLIGKGQLSELLMKTEMEKLSILTGGSAQAKPAELIGSRKMETLIRELKSRYNDRYIILDATPLLATSEPEVLARLVDGILIVVRANVTPRETIKQAVASLDPKKILGFVLNDVEFKSSGLSSRYFGSDGYYTQYGYGKKGTDLRSKSGKMSPFKRKSD
jgi:exopolysaccharide/PEP-CTERM locus tyrosine autokinase